jgi:hypothetical protein
MTTTKQTNSQELPIVPKELKTENLSAQSTNSSEQLNEVQLTWAGKLFFASIAAYIASDVAQAMKLPIKLRGKPEEIKSVVDAITASKDFQREIKKPGAKVEDVVKKLNLKNMNKQQFEKLTGRSWPL